MKKKLLLVATCLVALTTVNGQVTTVAELKSAIETAATADLVVTVGDVALNFQTELDAAESTYSITVPDVVKNLTIAGSTANSEIVIKSQLLKPSTAMSKLVVKDLKLTGKDASDHYILNLDVADTDITELLIDNCSVSAMRGVFRIKTENIKVGSLTINNCLVSDIGSYSVVALDCGTVTSVALTNNTFYKFNSISEHKNLVTCKNPVTAATEVRITNFKMDKNTLHGVVKAGSYIADFGKINNSAVAISGEFIFTNNLLGASYTAGTKAFSKVDYETANTGGNYISKSWTMNGVDKFFEVISTDPVTEENVYTLDIDAATLFPNLATGNFTIAQGQVYSAAGDPRWNGGASNLGSAEVSGRIVSTEYYNVAGVKLNAPSAGLNIVKQIMEDGSVKSTKVYVK